MVELLGYMPVFHQLRLNMGHQQQISINYPSHGEACSYFERG